MARSKDSAPAAGQPAQRPGENGGANRRRYYRINIPLRFRVLRPEAGNRVWAHSEQDRLPNLYAPKGEELYQARALLAEVPEATVDLSEGGMRMRIDPERDDLADLGYGRRTRNKRVRVLLELDEPEDRAILHLPAWVVRVDQPSRRLRFVALTFMEVPAGISQLLESYVLRAERRRLRHVLLGGNISEEGEAARQLLNLERGELKRLRRDQEQKRQQPKPRGKSFP